MILACPYCKAKADPAVSTCTSCGKRMTRPCPACAETISALSTNCKYCGEAMTPVREPAPAKPDAGIVFLEEKPGKKKKCCAGRTMFWMIVGLLAGFCAYSAVKTKMTCSRVVEPVKQEMKAPAGREF